MQQQNADVQHLLYDAVSPFTQAENGIYTELIEHLFGRLADKLEFESMFRELA